MSKPKVMIGVAAFAGVVPEAQENFFALAYRLGRDHPEYDFMLKILLKREQFRARNALVNLALANDCEYLFMLDDDMIVPADLFAKLKAHDKPVVGALYYQRGGAYHPVIMRQTNQKDGLKGIQFIQPFDRMLVKPGLYQVDIIGGGCMLLKTDVFRKLPEPYFWVDGIVGTDVHLCNQLKVAGIPVYVDTSIELGHVGDAQIVTSRTIPHYSQVLGQVNEQLWDDLKAYLCMVDLELEQAITKAAGGEHARADVWNSRPRDTWEDVREFYQSGGQWALLNLAAYNLKFDEARAYVLNEVEKLVKPGGHIADYGAGLGYCAIPLAQKGYHVAAVDLAGTPTMAFLQHRANRHGLLETFHPIAFEDPVPPPLPRPADLVLMISVLDHLWDPSGALDWVDRHTKPGGYFLCDTWRSLRHADEPQHLVKFDAHRFLEQMRKRGWRLLPDNPFLFQKER